MTSLASWSGVDSRGPSSIYLVSDSRISWAGTPSSFDYGSKVFASSASTDIFSYCGDVLFPVITLGQIESLIAEGILGFEHLTGVQRHSEVVTLLKVAFKRFPEAHHIPFSIFHANREESGMDSRFSLWILNWIPSSGWTDTKIAVSTESVLLSALGSGHQVVTSCEAKWSSQMGRTSRGVFGAFCDAPRSMETSLSVFDKC